MKIWRPYQPSFCTGVRNLLLTLVLLEWFQDGKGCQIPVHLEGLKTNETFIELGKDPQNDKQEKGILESPGFAGPSSLLGPGRYVYHLVSRDKPACIYMVFTDFLLMASYNISLCDSQSTHVKISDGLNSTFHCGAHRPHPSLSATQCLTLQLTITESDQIALMRAAYEVLPYDQCQIASNKLSPHTFFQRTQLLTSDLDHLDASIPWTEWTEFVTIDFLWYIKLQRRSYIVFSFEEFQMSGNSTLEIRDGPTSLSPVIFSSSNASVPAFVSTEEDFVEVRWWGKIDNKSLIHMVYSSIEPLGPQGNNACMCENAGDAGICILDGSSQKCFCPNGFVGKKCQTPAEAKAHHLAAVIARCSCRNGGTCTPTSTGFGFVCSCPPGFSGFDCALNNTSIPATSAEYGIAMGAAVVAVLLVMFGIALCMCVILQYIRQQREGPEGNYRPALSRDVYSVEGVNISGILRIESLEANNYVPPSYSQCVHSTPNSPIDSEVFLSPAHSNQSVRAWHHIQRAQRTPDSPPPTYDAIIGICKQCSQLRKGGHKFRNMKSLGSEPALIRYSRGQQIVNSEYRPTSLPTTPQDVMELREVR